MREVALRVAADAVEQVLDELLPIVPDGVRELPDGDHVELVMRGDELPARAELARAAGRFAATLRERSVSDDWRARRVEDYRPDVIAGRLVIGPDWAPLPSGPALETIVLGDSAAFGAGSHPTTRACLELLLNIAPSGAFADLGCGTGVLAILAARLGWGPVRAVDLDSGSVAATRENAARNGVIVSADVGDLVALGMPRAAGVAANVPPAVHRALAASLAEPLPRVLLLSGFAPADSDAVLDPYLAAGLHERARLAREGWTIALLASG